MYKLYYQNSPHEPLMQEELRKAMPFQYTYGIWAPNTISKIAELLTAMGLEYGWTNDLNDPECIPIVEIDSMDPYLLGDTVRMASEKFPKAIVLSATEAVSAVTTRILDYFREQYPNVLIVYAGDYVLNNAWENLKLFPFYILRARTPSLLDIKCHNLPDCNYMSQRKPYIFNHLAKHWAPEKYHTHYTIKKHFNRNFAGTDVSRCLLSYRNFKSKINRSDRMKSAMEITHHKYTGLSRKYTRASQYYGDDYLTNAQDFQDEYLPVDYSEDQFYRDPGIGMVKWHHPEFLYKNSYISLVSEVEVSFSIMDVDDVTLPPLYERMKNSIDYQVANYIITEKTLQPIVNNHIFITANCGVFSQLNTRYFRDTLGLQIFEELFDYDAIDTYGETQGTYKVVKQLEALPDDAVLDNAKILKEKVEYNKHLVLGDSSELIENLRSIFQRDILDYFLNMDF